MRRNFNDENYELFLVGATAEGLVFANNRLFSGGLTGGLSVAFWSVYVFFLRPLDPSKYSSVPVYFVLFLACLASLMFVVLVTRSQRLVLDPEEQSAVFEARTLLDRRHWRKSADDFEAVRLFLASQHGRRKKEHMSWVTELLLKDGRVVPVVEKVMARPYSEKAQAQDFAQCVADAMGLSLQIDES